MYEEKKFLNQSEKYKLACLLTFIFSPHLSPPPTPLFFKGSFNQTGRFSLNLICVELKY